MPATRALTAWGAYARVRRAWAISSVAERFLHTEEATGSIPVSPTILGSPPPAALFPPTQNDKFVDKF